MKTIVNLRGGREHGAWPLQKEACERHGIQLAKAQGAEGFGPIRRPDELPRALRAAIECVERGGVSVVDVRVEPGYAPVDSAATSRGASG